MKKFKIALLFLILAALFVVAYQNREFFLTAQKLTVDLKVWGYQTPDIPHGLYFLGCFLVGFLLAYASGLVAKFKSGKMVKELNAVIDSQQEKISTLRGEMDLLKRRPVAQEPVVEEPAPAEAVEEDTEKETETEPAPQQK